MPRLNAKTKKLDAAIGAAIRKHREARGMSQTAVADKLGVKFQQFQKYENGTNRISLSAFILTAKAMGVPAEAILSDIGRTS